MLSRSQLETYDENGYVILENFLTPEDTQGVMGEYERIIDGRAREAVASGKLSTTFEDEPFDTRFVKLAAAVPDITKGLDIMQTRGPRMFEFLHNPKLLDVMESVFGPELLCSPVQHVRIVPPLATKTQSVGAAYSWHQDYAVLWPEADGYLIAGLWIPMVDATLENGCLEVIPGSHKLGPLPHRRITEVETVPEAVPKTTPTPVPIKAGGAILLRNYILHRARPNTSNRVRWSMDLRYQDPYTPTGRPFYPSFIVRSKIKPESVLNDYQRWSKNWEFALGATEDRKSVV
jgi:phytanoyl-CoA hydroxylase